MGGVGHNCSSLSWIQAPWAGFWWHIRLRLLYRTRCAAALPEHEPSFAAHQSSCFCLQIKTVLSTELFAAMCTRSCRGRASEYELGFYSSCLQEALSIQRCPYLHYLQGAAASRSSTDLRVKLVPPVPDGLRSLVSDSLLTGGKGANKLFTPSLIQTLT